MKPSLHFAKRIEREVKIRRLAALHFRKRLAQYPEVRELLREARS